jgi:hypothetical protein
MRFFLHSYFVTHFFLLEMRPKVHALKTGKIRTQWEKLLDELFASSSEPDESKTKTKLEEDKPKRGKRRPKPYSR